MPHTRETDIEPEGGLTIDCDRCTSSLTRAQSIVDPDGKVRRGLARAVGQDPGRGAQRDARAVGDVLQRRPRSVHSASLTRLAGPA